MLGWKVPIRRLSTTVALVSTLAFAAFACGSSEPTTSVDVGQTPQVGDTSSTSDPEHLDRSPAGWFPPLNDPEFVSASEVDWLADEDVVLGVFRGGSALALPVGQMAFHHIANLDIDGEPYLVTY